jgi:hypothetical protein
LKSYSDSMLSFSCVIGLPHEVMVGGRVKRLPSLVARFS